jgi:hypothetical protein
MHIRETAANRDDDVGLRVTRRDVDPLSAAGGRKPAPGPARSRPVPSDPTRAKQDSSNRRDLDRKLDEALDETFPASDPPAVS